MSGEILLLIPIQFVMFFLAETPVFACLRPIRLHDPIDQHGEKSTDGIHSTSPQLGHEVNDWCRKVKEIGQLRNDSHEKVDRLGQIATDVAWTR